MKDSIRRAFEESWKRNEAGYRYLANEGERHAEKPRKPSNNYSDDPVITALAIGIVVAWIIGIVYLVKWVMELPK